MNESNNLKVHFSSKKQDWATPPELFNQLSEEFGGFDLDAAASSSNSKCIRYYSEPDDSLRLPWTIYDPPLWGPPEYLFQGKPLTRIDKVWLNPPYGRTLKYWVKKAYDESAKGCIVVCLLPARTDTRWFHDYIYGHGRVDIRFLKGRIKFVGAAHGAPFPSMIVVFY